MADEVGESLKLNIKITSTGEDKLQTIAESVATLERFLSPVTTQFNAFGTAVSSIDTSGLNNAKKAMNGIPEATDEASKAANSVKDPLKAAGDAAKELENVKVGDNISNGIKKVALSSKKVSENLDRAQKSAGELGSSFQQVKQ